MWMCDPTAIDLRWNGVLSADFAGADRSLRSSGVCDSVDGGHAELVLGRQLDQHLLSSCLDA